MKSARHILDAAGPSPTNEHAFATRHIAIFVLALSASIFIFFKQQFLNEFTVLFGDTYDGFVELSVLEHWFNVFRGFSHWNITNYYYPQPDTLGYLDGYFIFGLFHSIFRTAGLDPFLSSELTNLSFKAVGFAGMFAFLKLAIDLQFRWAILGSVIFTLSSSTFERADVAIVLVVAFAPILALLIFLTLRAVMADRPGQVAIWGITTALFYGAWLMTAFYTAWFFAFFAMAYGIAMLVQADRASLARALSAVRRQAWPLAISIVALAIALTPFLVTYLPTAMETGMHPFSEVKFFINSPLDALYLGADNWVFGGVFGQFEMIFGADFRGPADHDHTMGLAPILALLVPVTAIWIVWARPVWRTKNIVALAASILLTWLLTTHIGDVYFWQPIYAVVPGARAIRILGRYVIFLDFPVVVLAMCFLADLSKNKPWADPAVAAVSLLAIVLVAEEIDLKGPLAVDRPTEAARLAQLKAPPSSCHASYTTNVRKPDPNRPLMGEAPTYGAQADAMLVSEYYGLPTINGLSSFIPVENQFASPLDPSYIGQIRRYARRHQIQGLCGLDVQTMQWLPPQGRLFDLPVKPLGRTLSVDYRSGDRDILESGWSSPEPWGVWSIGQTASLTVQYDRPLDTGMKLTIVAGGFPRPPAATQHVLVFVNGRAIGALEVPPPQSELTLTVPRPDDPNAPLEIRFEIPDPVSPKEVGGSSDARKIGLGLSAIRLEPISDGG